MKYKERILRIILKFFWIFAKRTKQRRNRITFITLESDKLENDFLLLSRELQKCGGYDLQYHLVKFEKTLAGNFSYLLSCIYQLFLINSSKVVLLDFNNYVVANFKRPDVKVIQIWHASGAIKKFGNMIPRDYIIRNYDYVICNADIFKPIFARAFAIEESNVINTGIPRTDLLFNTQWLEEKKKEFFKQYPELSEKKIILYAPTFRGRLMEGLKDVGLDMNKLAKELPEQYVIVYKMHPLINDRRQYCNDRIICANHEELYKLLAVADCLISDYSAVIFDYSIFEKPIYFYTPDYEEYKNMPGFCIDYNDEIPIESCVNVKTLARQIRNNTYNVMALKKFKTKYFEHTDGMSCRRVVDLIEHVISE